MSGVWFKDDLPFEQHRDLLDRLLNKKIRMCDAVVLIHPDAKGEHTQAELKYAFIEKKPIVVFKDIGQAVGELISRIQAACDHKKPDGSSAFEQDMCDHKPLYGFLVCSKCGKVVHT